MSEQPDVIIPDPPPSVTDRELAPLRRQTKQYISENPSDLEVERPQWEDDGAGGRRNLGSQFLSAQRVRVIQQREGQGTERRLVSGEVVVPTLSVLFDWNGDVEIGDFMSWKGYRIEVVWITDLRYEKTAEVVVR